MLFEDTTGVIDSEGPMNLAGGMITLNLPGHEFGPQRPLIREATTQTLMTHDANLNLSHVQPGTMGRCVMEAEPVHDTVSLLFAKYLNQDHVTMGVEIVQDDIDALGLRVQDIDQIAHCMSEIEFLAVPGDQHSPSAALGLNENKEISRALTLVLIVFLPAVAWLARDWLASVVQQLVAGFIETNLRSSWVVWLAVQRQNLLHALDEQGRYCGDAPALDQPGLELVFLSVRRTFSQLMESTMPSATSLSVSSSIVHLERPSGGSLQARATRYASCSSLRVGSLAGWGLPFRANSSPSSQKRTRVRRTDSSPVYKTSAISLSVMPS